MEKKEKDGAAWPQKNRLVPPKLLKSSMFRAFSGLDEQGRPPQRDKSLVEFKDKMQQRVSRVSRLLKSQGLKLSSAPFQTRRLLEATEAELDSLEERLSLKTKS